MPSSDRQHLLEREALARLGAHFEADGWRRPVEGPASEAGAPRPDLVLERDGRRLAFEVKVLSGPVRREALRGRLADGILCARAAADPARAEPVAIVVARKLSDASLASLRDYVQRVAPDLAWGALDAFGRLELHGEGLPRSVDAELEPIVDLDERIAPRRPGGRANPFSDLGQWMNKVLLASSVDDGLLRAPRRPIASVSNLADAARVSLASASRHVSALESLGLLERARSRLRIVRRADLLRRWAAEASRPSRSRRVRFVFPARDALGQLGEVVRANAGFASAGADDSAPVVGAEGRRACLGYFAAARALGLGHVHGAPLHVYAEDLSQRGLERIGLLPVEGEGAFDAIVVEPRAPESVFRGCVGRDGVPVADALQCWLDLLIHPSRGAEQAREIMERLGGLDRD